MMATKVLVLCCVLAGVLAGEKYTSKYDNIDLDELMQNERLFNAHVNCLLDMGKCTPEAKELKDHLQDALETGCSKCTEAQEKGAAKMINHLVNEKKEIWEKLCAKYDPTGKWRKHYEERAKKEGIKL
ncbi:allergen Tha p 1-like [Epargyreus clarus]|uniref:allergen Tha p 1-like n=1 Tax=Epargyreus clarus TaxID=520877 RepID=UPI003C2CA914